MTSSLSFILRKFNLQYMYYDSSSYMELGLALDLLMCNYSSALASTVVFEYTLHLADIHALRASQPQSTRRFRPARGCSARQRATAKALYSILASRAI